MTAAREEILRRVRTALSDRPAPPPVPRTYRRAGSVFGGHLLDLLAERLRDYRASVEIVPADNVADAVASALAKRGAGTVVVPEGFPEAALARASAEVLRDDPPLPVAALDRADGVLTTCAWAVAETGTIVLDHGAGQGRRALTLVPDFHLVVIRAEHVLADVPGAVAQLGAAPTQTWISGPSATSDIELNRVEGVHGPRTLHVVIVSES
jgi:L-lactate dehydrogenase complex protein LldG